LAHVRPEQRLGDWPGGIEFVIDRHQVFQNRLGDVRLGRIVNFVAGAIEDDARMIAIAQDGVACVGLEPVAEVEVIVVGILADRPAVKHLVHHDKSLAIAHVEEIRRRWIVGRADRIGAEFFSAPAAVFPTPHSAPPPQTPRRRCERKRL